MEARSPPCAALTMGLGGEIETPAWRRPLTPNPSPPEGEGSQDTGITPLRRSDA